MPRVPYVEKLRSWNLSHDESPSAGSGNCYCKPIETTSGVRRAARLVGTVGTTGSPSLKRICYQRKQKRPRTLKSKNSMRVSGRNSACAEFRTFAKALTNSPGLATRSEQGEGPWKVGSRFSRMVLRAKA
jgi:hypothetical protein